MWGGVCFRCVCSRMCVCIVVCVQHLHPSPLVFVQGFAGESRFLAVHLAQHRNSRVPMMRSGSGEAC